MPEIHIERHGDRWAVKEDPDAAPVFESYTLAEAESDARRRAGGGRVVVSEDDRERAEAGRSGVGQDREKPPGNLEAQDADTHADPGKTGDIGRSPQAGL